MSSFSFEPTSSEWNSRLPSADEFEQVTKLRNVSSYSCRVWNKSITVRLYILVYIIQYTLSKQFNSTFFYFYDFVTYRCQDNFCVCQNIISVPKWSGLAYTRRPLSIQRDLSEVLKRVYRGSLISSNRRFSRRSRKTAKNTSKVSAKNLWYGVELR